MFENNIEEYETIITGISYFVSGIIGNKLKRRGINFAFDSQDLYCDYHITKYLLEKYKTNFKYSIIGLNYFTFQYDMSLSAMKDNMKIYYPTLKKKHNLVFKDDYNRLIINKEIANKIIEKNNVVRTIFKPLNKSNKLYEVGKAQAELDCNKNYPKTVIENTKILKDYLELLIANNIKPIIVICPVTKYYSNYFSERIKEEFFEIINSLRCNYNFQYIDYFESKLFDDNLFYDVSHLTFEGGEKFTMILNEEISW